MQSNESKDQHKGLAEIKQKAEGVIARLQEEFEDKLHDLWKKVKEKRGVPVLLKHEEDNPIKAGKALGLMPGHPELLLKILQSLDYYPEIDPLYAGGHVVEKFPDGIHEVLYSVFSSGFNWVVSPRDFCYAEARRKYDDGKVIIACFSVEREDVPPVRGNVRGNIFYSGWVLSPCVPTEEEKEKAGLQDCKTEHWCNALFVAQVDIGGWIPTWLVNKMGGELGESLHRLRKFLKEKGHKIALDGDEH